MELTTQGFFDASKEEYHRLVLESFRNWQLEMFGKVIQHRRPEKVFVLSDNRGRSIRG